MFKIGFHKKVYEFFEERFEDTKGVIIIRF